MWWWRNALDNAGLDTRFSKDTDKAVACLKIAIGKNLYGVYKSAENHINN